MKQQEVFKKIGTIIKELNEQYDYLKTTGEDLNDLELELFVANAHFLADHAAILRKLNSINAPAPVIASKPDIVKEEKYFEPVVQQVIPQAEVIPGVEEPEAAALTPEKPTESDVEDDSPVPHIDLGANGADDDFSYIRQEPETIRHELTLEDIPNWEDEDDEGFVSEELTEPEEEAEEVIPVEPIKPVAEEPKVEVVKTETAKPVAEKPQAEQKAGHPLDEPLTINQRISAQLSNTGAKISEQLHAQPVADLKTAITLNDKLLYIKDLFNGYNLAYSEAIDILNRFTTFAEAEDFLHKSYAVKNDWASKQATADKFYALLRRRY
ncbi:MAG TPA: hypothetical protein VK668_19495 [Mucilaginibacter sp.]|nr:hypothetical protein [Mucilaginibacter sp.]